jgi:hypothetical protein
VPVLTEHRSVEGPGGTLKPWPSSWMFPSSSRKSTWSTSRLRCVL